MNGALPYTANAPKTFGQILDRVFRLLRANLKLFVGIAMVPPLAFFLSIGLVMGGFVIPMYGSLPRNPSPAQDAQFGVVVLPAMIIIFLVYGVVFAPCFAAAAEAAVQADLGIRVTFRESYSNAFRRFWRHLLLLTLICALAMGPVIVLQLAASLIGALVARGNSAPGPAVFVFLPVSILLALACFAFSIVVSLRLSLAFPASVTEGLTAVSALKRSNQLTKRAKGRIFVVLLVVYAVAYIAYLFAMVASLLVFGVVALFGSLLHMNLPLPVRIFLFCIGAIAALGVMVLFMAGSCAGYATALAVIYNDQRMRVDAQPAAVAPTGAPA